MSPQTSATRCSKIDRQPMWRPTGNTDARQGEGRLCRPKLRQRRKAGLCGSIRARRSTWPSRQVSISKPRLRKAETSTTKASMAQDLELGRAMEIDAMFTVPLMLARELKIATPTLDLLAALVRLRAKSAGLYTEMPLRR